MLSMKISTSWPIRVAEVLGHRHAGERDARADARRLVHLPEDERRLVDDARLLHLVPHVVAFARPLAHAGEHGEPAVLRGDVADELLDDHGLAGARAAVGADLAALRERRDEVEHLHAGLEDVRRSLALLERRRRRWIGQCSSALTGAEVVDRLAQHVEQPPEARLAHRHGDRRARVGHSAPRAPGRLSCPSPAPAPSCSPGAAAPRRSASCRAEVDLDGVVDVRQLLRLKLDVHDGADDLHYLSLTSLSHS